MTFTLHSGKWYLSRDILRHNPFKLGPTVSQSDLCSAFTFHFYFSKSPPSTTTSSNVFFHLDAPPFCVLHCLFPPSALKKGGSAARKVTSYLRTCCTLSCRHLLSIPPSATRALSRNYTVRSRERRL